MARLKAVLDGCVYPINGLEEARLLDSLKARPCRNCAPSGWDGRSTRPYLACFYPVISNLQALAHSR